MLYSGDLKSQVFRILNGQNRFVCKWYGFYMSLITVPLLCLFIWEKPDYHRHGNGTRTVYIWAYHLAQNVHGPPFHHPFISLDLTCVKDKINTKWIFTKMLYSLKIIKSHVVLQKLIIQNKVTDFCFILTQLTQNLRQRSIFFFQFLIKPRMFKLKVLQYRLAQENKILGSFYFWTVKPTTYFFGLKCPSCN